MLLALVYSQFSNQLGKPEAASLSTECQVAFDEFNSCISKLSGNQADKCVTCSSKFEVMKTKCAFEISINTVSEVACEKIDNKLCYDEVKGSDTAFKTFDCSNPCQKKFAAYLRDQSLFKTLVAAYGWKVAEVEACVGVSCLSRAAEYSTCLSGSANSTYTSHCDKCEHLKVPCSCYNSEFTFDGSAASELQLRNNTLWSAQFWSQGACAKIDGQSCGKEFFKNSGNVFSYPTFSCDNKCHRNFYKNAKAPFVWPSTNYKDCPLSESLSECKIAAQGSNALSLDAMNTVCLAMFVLLFK